MRGISCAGVVVRLRLGESARPGVCGFFGALVSAFDFMLQRGQDAGLPWVQVYVGARGEEGRKRN